MVAFLKTDKKEEVTPVGGVTEMSPIFPVIYTDENENKFIKSGYDIDEQEDIDPSMVPYTTRFSPFIDTGVAIDPATIAFDVDINPTTNTMIVGTYKAVDLSRSTDLGKTWTGIDTSAHICYTVCYGNGVWCTGHYFGKILRSTDDGVNFTVVHDHNDRMRYIVTDKNGNWIASANDGSKFYSTDNGLTWNTVTQPITSPVYAGNGDVYAFSNEDGNIYKSTDHGATFSIFTALPTDIGINTISIHADRMFIEAHGPYIWYSDDFGVTWNESFISDVWGGTTYRNIKSDGNGNLVLTARNYCWCSNDNGETWYTVSNDVESEYATIYIAAEDHWLTFKTDGGRVLKSQNRYGLKFNTGNSAEYLRIK